MTDIKSMIEYNKGGIVSKVLKKGKSSVTLFCMAAGTELDEHTSTREGMVYVIEGKGSFVLEGESIEMLPGKMIFMEKGAVHSLRAEENTAFLLVLAE